jgi:hypothetical protein
MKFTLKFFIAGICLMLSSSCLFAQDKNGSTVDMIGTKPETWRTASMALPYGIIFSGGFPVLGGPNKDGGFTDKVNAGIDFYYDAWLVGLHQCEHGDVIRFGPRSLSRDLYGGWYVEAGTRGYSYQTINFHDNNNNDTSVNSSSLVILAFGFGNRTNYSSLSPIAVIGAYNVTLGVAQSSTGHSSFPIMEFEYNIGLRIPMDKNALSVIVRLVGGLGLPPSSTSVPYYNSPYGFGEVNLTLQYALNFDKY